MPVSSSFAQTGARACRLGASLLVGATFAGCDLSILADPLPTRAELTAEFETPAPGVAVIRTGSLRSGEDVSVSAQALGVDEPDTFLYVVFCDGETSAGAVYDMNAPYPSLRAGLDLDGQGSGGAVIYITDVADDGAVSGLFAYDLFSEIVGRRRRIQGAFNARPVEPTYTCQR